MNIFQNRSRGVAVNGLNHDIEVGEYCMDFPHYGPLNHDIEVGEYCMDFPHYGPLNHGKDE